jgi:4-diphosphocytidyl-2-C-methyl-D-erythritol kinase
MSHRVTVHCPAKVNLGLEVLGRRADGYHDICTVMQAVDLYDELMLEVVDGDGSGTPCIEVSGPFAGEVPEAGNTLLVAWAVAGGNRLPALKVRLVKNIPSGAGLGGGSSDGAGMLVGMREISMLVNKALGGAPARPASGKPDIEEGRAGATPTVEMQQLAIRIGSDCPFFLSGGTQLAQGRGEQLTALHRKLDFHLIIAVPEFGSTTGSAYTALRRAQQPMTPMLVPQLARALERGDMDLFRASIVNDFEPHLRQLHPEYAGWFDALLASGALAVLLTGSGSGFYGIFADEVTAQAGLASLQDQPMRHAGVHRPIHHQ